MHQGLLPHIGPEAEVPGMNTTAGGPTVDRTLTGVLETLALTSASVAEEPRGEPAMIETFTPRIGAVTQDSKAETSPGGQVRPAMNLSQPSDSSARISATPTINHASVSDVITRLQQEKARVQKELDKKRAAYNDLNNKHIRALSLNDVLVADNTKQRQMINSLQRELGENDAEFDDDSDDPLLHRIRRECEKRVKDCEERLKQSQAEGQL
jgi:hypothetical protein